MNEFVNCVLNDLNTISLRFQVHLYFDAVVLTWMNMNDNDLTDHNNYCTNSQFNPCTYITNQLFLTFQIEFFCLIFCCVNLYTRLINACISILQNSAINICTWKRGKTVLIWLFTYSFIKAKIKTGSLSARRCSNELLLTIINYYYFTNDFTISFYKISNLKMNFWPMREA